MVVKEITERFVGTKSKILSHIPLPNYKIVMTKEIDPSAVDFEKGIVKLKPRYKDEWYITYWYKLEE